MARRNQERKDFRVAVGAEPADRAISPLRADLRISPQLFYGQLCFVVKDPVTLRYFRLQPVEHFLVTQFDGQRTARDLLATLQQQFPETALTVQDVLRFVGMLHESHLLVGEGIAHAEWLSKRASASRRRRLMEALQSFFFLKLPLFNPEKVLTVMENTLGRVIFHPATGLGAILLVLLALWQVLLNTDRFADMPYNLLSWQNLGVLYAVFIVTKIFHEFGHGLAAKHFGGEVSQMGVMLFVFTPSFYCDTSDAWMIPSRAARLWINAGGIVVELVLAALATFVWLNTQNDTLVNQIALNVMISCSVATLFFNANPLLKYDGYYFLADLLEIPNLYTKGREFLGYYVKKHVLGLKPIMPPDRKRLPWLITYAIASGVYRWFVFFAVISLLYFFFDNYGLGPLGVLLAVLYVALTVLLPVGKAVKFLWKQRWDIYRRLAWVGAAVGGGAAALVLIALLPWTHTIRAPLEIKPDEPAAGVLADAAIVVQTPGYIREVCADVGDTVKRGDVIVRMINPELEGQLRSAVARREQQVVVMQNAQLGKNAAGYTGALEAVKAYDKQIALLKQRQEELCLRAPISGVLVPPRAEPTAVAQLAPDQSLKQLMGNYVPLSFRLGRVIQPDRLMATLSLPQSQADLVHAGMDVKVRLWSDPHTLLSAKVVRKAATVSDEIVHRSLGANVKGDIAVTADAQGRLKYTGRRITVYVQVPRAAAFLADGMTGRGEITVQRTQVYQRLWRLILDSTTPDWHL